MNERFSEIPSFAGRAEECALQLQRTDLDLSSFPGANRCFLVRNFLSREECVHYREAAESAGFGSIKTEYPEG